MPFDRRAQARRAAIRARILQADRRPPLAGPLNSPDALATTSGSDTDDVDPRSSQAPAPRINLATDERTAFPHPFPGAMTSQLNRYALRGRRGCSVDQSSLLLDGQKGVKKPCAFTRARAGPPPPRGERHPPTPRRPAVSVAVPRGAGRVPGFVRRDVGAVARRPNLRGDRVAAQPRSTDRDSRSPRHPDASSRFHASDRQQNGRATLGPTSRRRARGIPVRGDGKR